MANQWFRLYSEFATDPKVQMLSEADQRRFIMLLCFRCSNEHVTLQDEEVTFLLRVTSEEWARTKAVFLAKNLINEDNTPTAWEKRQFASDSSAARVAKHRAKKKDRQNADVTLQETKSNAVDTDTEAERTTEADASVVGGDAANESAIRKTDRLPDCPQQEILALYAEILPDLPQPIAWEGARATNLRARWRWVLADRLRKGKPCDRDAGIDFFRRMFGYVAGNDFLSGRTSGWKGCDLGWLVKAENFAKVIAGNYDGKEAA